jgi:hypothetical protein
MSTPRPRDREPSCIHSGWSGGIRVDRLMQPASACRICKDGPELAKWMADWAAWAEENPEEYRRLIERSDWLSAHTPGR